MEYPGRWIGRGGPVLWPPRSPDLTSLDFFLWGHLKELVYRDEHLWDEDGPSKAKENSGPDGTAHHGAQQGKSFDQRGWSDILIWNQKHPNNVNLLPPSEDINTTLQQIEQCLNIPHEGTIIAGDFNAKSPVWGGTQEDDRGKCLVNFALSRGLAILNDENSPPTFYGSRGISWIDVLFCDASLIENIFKCQVDMVATCSDHNSISFSLYTGKIVANGKIRRRTKLANLELATFRRELSNFIDKWEPPTIHTPREIDLETDKLHEAITSMWDSVQEQNDHIRVTFKRLVAWDLCLGRF
ncbi:hypothetical protein AVEN_230681-1 [Araneus ventricosus]|uniref:Endonuclease/exonuclease/phosphatase domain-containing protein n=1 Tax=Araneus ventricosus TaxID=182803 RepID=A0A4Y2A2B7_ARAVE|nr:hypothetical protein AVEN_230681-1 [Araneus ventricosus]